MHSLLLLLLFLLFLLAKPLRDEEGNFSDDVTLYHHLMLLFTLTLALTLALTLTFILTLTVHYPDLIICHDRQAAERGGSRYQRRNHCLYPLRNSSRGARCKAGRRDWKRYDAFLHLSLLIDYLENLFLSLVSVFIDVDNVVTCRPTLRRCDDDVWLHFTIIIILTLLTFIRLILQESYIDRTHISTLIPLLPTLWLIPLVPSSDRHQWRLRYSDHARTYRCHRGDHTLELSTINGNMEGIYQDFSLGSSAILTLILLVALAIAGSCILLPPSISTWS